MADETEVVADETATGEKPDKTVVSEEVATLLKERDRREKEMRLKAEKAEKKLQAELDTMRKQMEELTGSVKKPKDGEDAETLQVKLDLLERRAKQQQEELQGQIERERKAREAAEEKERQNERLRLLTEALDAVGVQNKELGKRCFKDQVVWDEVDERWAYRTQDGKVVALKEGIELELPPELKPSTLRAGTGSTGSTTAGKGKAQKELEQIELQMSNLQKEIQRRGSAPILVGQFDQLIKKRNLLRLELTKAK